MSRVARFIRLCWILGILTPAFAYSPPLPAHQRVDHTAAGWPVGAFTLTDHRGGAFTQEHLNGHWTFVMLGNSRCGEPCGAALEALAGLFRRIGKTQAIRTTQVALISMDSQGDTPARLARYLEPYDPRFIGATGPWSTLERLADDLGVSPTAADHVGSLWLIGPDGVVRVRFLPSHDVLLLTAEFLKIRARG
jgi:protein SCO1